MGTKRCRAYNEHQTARDKAEHAVADVRAPCPDEMRMKQTALARPLAWSIAALSLMLTMAGLGLNILARAQGHGEGWLGVHILFGPGTAITYALVGALVASRQPRNPIGWIFSAVGMFAGLTLLSSGYEMVGQSGEVTLPGNDIARWLGLWAWMPVTILPLTFVLLLFPNGRLPSPRWRPVGWAAGLGLAAFIISTALHPRPPIEPIPPHNPYGIPGATRALDLLGYIVGPLLLVGVFGALAAVVARFRHSRGIEREQVKWLAYAGAMGILGLSGMNAWMASRPGDLVAYELTLSTVWITLTLIVAAAGIAILRHRLYDIDLLINRTLVYGTLSAGVIGIYILLVGALGALFQSSGNLAIALLATGLAALLAQPLRARLQRSVNRLMYGERDDPYTVLSRLSQQLKTTLAPTAVLPNIAEAIAQSLKLPYVALALKHGTHLETAAAYGMPAGEPVRLPLVYQAETVGQLLVEPRAPGEAFTPAERRLLEDIALQAGIAAHAVQLTLDLQRSRERLVTAREEERRRLRRDLHDGLGPTLASLSMQLDAAQALVADNPREGVALLGVIRREMQETIGTVRRLVYALRPPVLDQFGLVAALREHALHLQRDGLLIAVEASSDRPSLPAAVEVATYYIVVEAMTNAARHARARHCAVRLTVGESWVDIAVTDDGAGLPPAYRPGVGIQSMRERAEELGGSFSLEAAAGGGTRVRARLPVFQ